MTTMHNKMAYHQPEGIPENLIIWQDENSGTAALVNAANDIVNGKKVLFALCNRIPGLNTPEIKEFVTIGTDGQSPRYCGENDDPSGAGSHALIPTWYDYSMNPAHIAVALARAFSNYDCFFRCTSC